MRAVRIEISEPWLRLLFRGWEMSAVETDCPTDIEITNATWNADRGMVVLTAVSSHFDDVRPGFVIPNWSPTFTSRTLPSVAEAVQIIMDAPDT